MWKKFKQWVAKWIVKIFPAPADVNPYVDEKKLKDAMDDLKLRPLPPDSPAATPPEGIDPKTGVSRLALSLGEAIVPYVGSPGEQAVTEKGLRRTLAQKTGETCMTCFGWGGMNNDCPDCGGTGSV